MLPPHPQRHADDPVKATRYWLREFVIGHDICPFAQYEFERDRIRYVPADGRDAAALLEQLIDECRYLDATPQTATTLMIITPGLEDFADYLDVLALVERLMQRAGYEGIYQLASFHPDYRFAGEPPNDPANLTNRSPLPILHLLREASIEAALKHCPHPERIPERNMALLRARGHDWWEALMACSNDK